MMMAVCPVIVMRYNLPSFACAQAQWSAYRPVFCEHVEPSLPMLGTRTGPSDLKPSSTLGQHRIPPSVRDRLACRFPTLETAPPLLQPDCEIRIRGPPPIRVFDDTDASAAAASAAACNPSPLQAGLHDYAEGCQSWPLPPASDSPAAIHCWPQPPGYCLSQPETSAGAAGRAFCQVDVCGGTGGATSTPGQRLSYSAALSSGGQSADPRRRRSRSRGGGGGLDSSCGTMPAVVATGAEAYQDPAIAAASAEWVAAGTNCLCDSDGPGHELFYLTRGADGRVPGTGGLSEPWTAATIAQWGEAAGGTALEDFPAWELAAEAAGALAVDVSDLDDATEVGPGREWLDPDSGGPGADAGASWQQSEDAMPVP